MKITKFTMSKSLTLSIALLLFAAISFAQKRAYGNYFNKSRYWGPMFVLKSDSTFDYVLRTNAGTLRFTNIDADGTIRTLQSDNYIFSDSSYGTYRIVNDTVFLNYATDMIQGDFNGHNIRPWRLYWKGRSLYYIDPQTDAVIRQKEKFMTWNKSKAPNLSRMDETWVTKPVD